MTKIFQVTKRFSEDNVKDILTSALEGGSNYWYMIKKTDNPSQSKYMSDVPFEGGALYIDDSNADLPELKQPVKVDIEALLKGLQRMADSETYKHHFADLVTDNADAITGDVFLQFCVFEDVIYG